MKGRQKGEWVKTGNRVGNGWKVCRVRNMDKGNIDGSCLVYIVLLIRRSIHKLLAEHFFVISKFPGPFVTQIMEKGSYMAQLDHTLVSFLSNAEAKHRLWF